MRDRLSKFTKAISWHEVVIGAIVGLLISTAFQPFLVSGMTDVYVQTGVYDRPELEVEFNEFDIKYPPGTEVPEFDDLEWKNNYTVYRFKVTNSGEKTIQDLEITTPLPGCAIYVNTAGPAVSGDYKVDDVVTVRYSNGTLDKTEITNYQCSKEISTEFLDPSDTLIVEFVVKDEFQRCDLLLGAPDNPDIITKYRWEVAGQYYSESEAIRKENIWNGFRDFTQKNPGKGSFMDEIEGRSYGAFIRTNTSSLAEGMQKCGVTWK